MSAFDKEMKVNQRKIFEDLALLDKRFNGFKVQQSTTKKKITTNHTPLFLKAKEARNEIIASTSTARAANLVNSLNRSTTSRRRTTTGTKRKVRRKRTKRKTAKKSTTKKSTTKVSIKKEIKKEFKVKVERKIKLKREF